MMTTLLIAIGFIVLYASAERPNCCLNNEQFENFLSAFSCNFTCELDQKQPILENCVSCTTNISNVDNYNAFESISFTKPSVICQDLLHKEEKVTSRVMLSWSSRNPLSAQFVEFLFLVEVRDSAVEKWHFVGMTNLTVATVNNLDTDLGYQFRVTPLATPNLTLPSAVSDWIFINDSKHAVMESLNFTTVSFKFQENYVQATIQWTASEDAPCSYILHWSLADNKFFGQKTISVSGGNSAIVLSGLFFQMNYTVKLVALYQTRMLKIKPAEMWFVTPSCLTLTRGNFSLCAPGPPSNLSVSWIHKTKALATWSPPDSTSPRNEVSGYHLAVIEASEKYHTIRHYKESFAFDKDILSATVSDLKHSVLYIFEIRASSVGGIGPPLAVELSVKEPSQISQQLSNVPWHYILPSSVLAFGAILVALCINCYRMRKRSKLLTYPSGTADVPDYLLPHLLQSKKVDLDEVIGKGEFGVVHKGVYSRSKDKEIVAVKVFPAESVSRIKLLHEVEILLTIGRHRNVVGLIGFTMDVDKISLVLEYCALGNLHARIRKLKRELSVIKKQLSDPKQPLLEYPKGRDEHYGIKVSSYIHQVALGMDHISSLKLIHRDLAARNILLYGENHVKIADFGLAKDISDTHSYTVSKQKKLPIRWMAPESLEKQLFTTKSDVWSFGILMWEIFKFGKVPYSPLNNSAILIYLKNGYRLPKPNATSQCWYDLMLECWHMNPLRRPTFRELVVKTESILSKLCQYTIVSTRFFHH